MIELVRLVGVAGAAHRAVAAAWSESGVHQRAQSAPPKASSWNER